MDENNCLIRNADGVVLAVRYGNKVFPGTSVACWERDDQRERTNLYLNNGHVVTIPDPLGLEMYHDARYSYDEFRQSVESARQRRMNPDA
jgi:hypothetical protein